MLADRQIDVWYVLAAEASDPALLARYRGLLTPEEIDRGNRLLRPKDRELFVVTRALTRLTLSRYADVAPQDWRFAANVHGKPFVEGPVFPLEFNLSHTKGLVACAVASQPVGIDVEPLDRPRVNLELARRFFSAREADALEQLPEAERRTGFLRYWTLKESYIKARGKGMAIPLGDFAFTWSRDEPARIAFLKPLSEDAHAWQFARVRLADRFQVAVALPAGSDATMTVQFRKTVPLVADAEPCNVELGHVGECVLE